MMALSLASAHVMREDVCKTALRTKKARTIVKDENMVAAMSDRIPCLLISKGRYLCMSASIPGRLIRNHPPLECYDSIKIRNAKQQGDCERKGSQESDSDSANAGSRDRRTWVWSFFCEMQGSIQSAIAETCRQEATHKADTIWPSTKIDERRPYKFRSCFG